MPFAIMYPFCYRGLVGGPRLPLHTEQPLLSHIDCFAEDLRVLPRGGGAGQRGGGLQPALLRRAFPLCLSPQGPASLPCPALGGVLQ